MKQDLSEGLLLLLLVSIIVIGAVSLWDVALYNLFARLSHALPPF